MKTIQGGSERQCSWERPPRCWHLQPEQWHRIKTPTAIGHSKLQATIRGLTQRRAARPVLAVVGDVSCQPGETEPAGEKAGENCDAPKSPYTSTSLWQSQEATANQIEAMKPDLVALLGDLQYQVGQYSDFENSYDLTYGAFKMITRPAPGNHEFYDEHGATGVAGYGYFSYFNGFQINATGQPSRLRSRTRAHHR